MRKIGYLVFLAALFVLLPTPVLAVKESITISPPKSEFKLSPGQQSGGVIKVANSGEEPVEVELYAQAFAVKNEQYDQEFNSNANPLAAQNWIKIGTTNHYLEPKQQVEVGYQVNVPNNVEPGGHYAAIFIQTRPQTGSSDSTLQIKRVAHLLYFEIAGQITRAGSIDSVRNNFWQPRSPIKSMVRIKNSGNTHYRVDGTITIKSLFGKEVSNIRVEGLLMPGTTRLFTADNEAPDWPGLYKIDAKIGFPSGKSGKTTSWVLYLPPVYIYMAAVVILVIGIPFIKKGIRGLGKHNH